MSDEIELPEADLGAVEAAVESFTIEPTRDEKGRFVPKYSEESGLPIDLDKEMDAAFDLIPDDLRAKAEMAPRDKKEQPKAEAQKEPAPKAEAETPVKAEGTESPKNAEAEKAIAQLRLARFPEEVLASASPQQLIQWAKPIGEMHARTASEFQKRTEELKRAQEAATRETTVQNGAPQAPAVSPDLQTALQAFQDVDDSFTKPMANLVQAIRKDLLLEIQPRVKEQAEIQSAYAEIVNETIRREIGERFSDLVADPEKRQELEQTAQRLWGESGATYEDAAPTALARYRACWNDAGNIVRGSALPPRKDDSQRKAQGLSAPPARQTPKKALSLDEDLDASYEAVAKRWEKH